MFGGATTTATPLAFIAKIKLSLCKFEFPAMQKSIKIETKIVRPMPIFNNYLFIFYIKKFTRNERRAR